jgi:hypothetical protein
VEVVIYVGKCWPVFKELAHPALATWSHCGKTAEPSFEPVPLQAFRPRVFP